MKFFTKTLSSGSLTISNSDYVQQVSIQANASSSCTFIGSAFFRGEGSTAIALENGEGITITSGVPNSPIDGLTITWVSGTIDVLIGYN